MIGTVENESFEMEDKLLVEMANTPQDPSINLLEKAKQQKKAMPKKTRFKGFICVPSISFAYCDSQNFCYCLGM